MSTKSRIAALLGAGAVAMAALLVIPFEGRSLTPYADTGGIMTVCDGHTGSVQSRRYSESECDALLVKDLFSHDADISKCLPTTLKDHERAAFLSFAFNVGAPAFCRSTMAKKASSGDVPGACRELSRWTYVAGKDCRIASNRCRGIVRRRDAERSLCEGKT